VVAFLWYKLAKGLRDHLCVMLQQRIRISLKFSHARLASFEYLKLVLGELAGLLEASELCP
jgi:hypothetical protein